MIMEICGEGFIFKLLPFGRTSVAERVIELIRGKGFYTQKSACGEPLVDEPQVRREFCSQKGLPGGGY
jgi:hypothetical protein